MQAFHNEQSVKDKYLDRVVAHQKADAIIQGTGWAGGKGCAVGCTLENYDHSQYPVELGIPEWLAHVEDTLFEGMSVERAKQWPAQFLSAVNVGADLEKVKAPFMLVVLRSVLENFDHVLYPDVKAAVDGSIALWSRDDIESAAWSAARSAAESAAWSAAESAAWSAAWSAARSAAESAARSAAWSAARSAAESAAESAAWSAARSAARSAAESAKYEYFADQLLSLLGECTA